MSVPSLVDSVCFFVCLLRRACVCLLVWSCVCLYVCLLVRVGGFFCWLVLCVVVCVVVLVCVIVCLFARVCLCV